MSNVKVTLAIGIALVLVMGAVVLTRSPPRLLLASATPPRASLGVTQSELTICQGNEVLPAGVTAIRTSIVAFLGSNMQIAAYHNGQRITQGSRNPAWAGSSVTVPVTALDHTTSDVRICVAFVPNSELLQIFGAPTNRRNAAMFFKGNQLTQQGPPGEGALLRGRLSLEYFGPGRKTWWSQALTVATNMGFGHFIGGKWVASLAALLVAAVGVLAVRITLREQP
jgi:hypothetical protein